MGVMACCSLALGTGILACEGFARIRQQPRAAEAARWVLAILLVASVMAVTAIAATLDVSPARKGGFPLLPVSGSPGQPGRGHL